MEGVQRADPQTPAGRRERRLIYGRAAAWPLFRPSFNSSFSTTDGKPRYAEDMAMKKLLQRATAYQDAVPAGEYLTAMYGNQL